ncbi:hypothetical protein QPK87_30235 [Kamptonema cortianum]|nr:hypothetical protein [Kamptonema cortianum]
MNKISLIIMILIMSLITIFIINKFILLDGITGEVMAFVKGDNTVYSSGYSDSHFSKIRRGMTMEEVEKNIRKTD